MAEASAAEGRPQEQGAPKGGKGLLLTAMLAPVLIVAGAAGAYLAFGRGAGHGAGSPEAGKADAPRGAAVEGTEQARPSKGVLALEPFVANLADPEGDRFIKCTIRLVVEDAEAAKAARESDIALTRIRDRILTLISSKAFAEVSTVEGKERLRREVQEQVSPFLEGGKVTEVYYTEFIVQ